MSAMINGGRPIEILLVEDSAEDAELTINSLKDGRIRNRVHHVEDGEEALEFLRNEGIHKNRPRPDLVLLDLCLPRLSGQEVLAIVKQDAKLKRIPVVIMTSSDDEKDIFAAYDRHANCYVTKPIDMDKFIDVVHQIEDFWLTVVRLPAA